MKYEIRLSLLSSLLCALLVLQSCNSGVFIRPLEIDTHEIVLDGAGTHVRVPVSTDDWNIKACSASARNRSRNMCRQAFTASTRPSEAIP